MPHNQAKPLSWGGEFRDQAREAEYRSGRLPEYVRHVRLLFRWAFFINILFLVSDWRWFGQPRFAFALSARAVIVLASLACLALAGRAQSFPALQRVCAAWCAPVVAACAVLVNPHNEIALFLVFILPLIFYLAIPMSFARTLAAGISCSALTLASYLSTAPDPATYPGQILAVLTINVVLALLLIRSNRLERLEWSATRAEQAATRAEQEANRELSEHRQMLETLLRAVPTPLVILDKASGRLIRANDAAQGYFGEAALRDPQAIRYFFDRKELVRLAMLQPSCGQVAQFETRLLMADGSWRDVLLVTTLTMVQGSEAIVAIVVDITNRKELEERLQKLASTDPLTGLANRSRFFALAASEVTRIRRYGRPLAVIMLDIDHFKDINDTYGHSLGDMALKAFAGVCLELLREPDIMARIGGEEFALLLPETDRSGALALAERLHGAVSAIRLENLSIAMTVSMGVSEVWPGETTVDAALSRADQALYAAKRAGRNRTMLHAQGAQEL